MLDLLPEVDSYLDLACGTGILTRMIAKKFPDSKITGLDNSGSYLDVAKKNSAAYENIAYVKCDAEKFSSSQKFGCIVSSYIPKYCDAEILADVCKNHLLPDGKIILHDFVYPDNVLVRKFLAEFRRETPQTLL